LADEEDRVTIAFKVVPNYELQYIILSYGEGVEVLQPEPLRELIRERLVRCSGKYNQPVDPACALSESVLAKSSLEVLA